MISKVYSAATFGIDAFTVTVETHIENQIPCFLVVGLPDNAVRESRERVTSAIKNSGFKFPVKRIIVNLAPANVRKAGSAFDLPVAIGIMQAEGLVGCSQSDETVLMGELALDGSLRPVQGALSVALAAKQRGFKQIILPKDNAPEAAMVRDIDVIPCRSLTDAVGYIQGSRPDLLPYRNDIREVFRIRRDNQSLDFSDVKGQENVKRALEVAAAGGHNIILIGPPGSGKTMLAKRIPSILPPMTFDEALETTRIHSVAGLLTAEAAIVASRPFRAPHHSISDAAMVGGGTGYARPGEISLSHHGVLFLDELPEFARNVLEVLRQPLEEGSVTISRSRISVRYPADFMLVSAMNPCPCGNFGNPVQSCMCTDMQRLRYIAKISGPLLDRIDIHIECPQVQYKDLTGSRTGESSADIRTRVIRAREIQQRRLRGRDALHCNAAMQPRDNRRYCVIDEAGKQLMKRASSRLGFSARAYDRILKVSRTIADLAGSDHIRAEHISEAIQYRALDRQS